MRGHLSPHQAHPMNSSGTEAAAAVRCPPWPSISSSGTYLAARSTPSGVSTGSSATEAAAPSTSPRPSTHYSTVSDAASPSILPDLSVRLRGNPAPSQLHVNDQLTLLNGQQRLSETELVEFLCCGSFKAVSTFIFPTIEETIIVACTINHFPVETRC